MAKSKHILIGHLGENIALGYVKNRGYSIIERNFRKKCGEIDLILEKDNVLHFVEVKSAEYYGVVPKEGGNVHRPEDHVDFHKKERFKRVIQVYLLEKKVSPEKEWTVDVVVVYVDTAAKTAHVRMLENVLLN